MKKVLLLLITLLSTNLQSFSQTVTDTSYVLLPRVIAEEVIKDLLLKDSFEQENRLLRQVIIGKEELLINRDEIISRLDDRIILLQLINSKRADQIETFMSLNEVLQTEIRRERLRKRFYQVTTSAAVAGIGVTILYYNGVFHSIR